MRKSTRIVGLMIFLWAFLGAWAQESPEFDIVIQDGHKNGWNMVVDPTGRFLISYGGQNDFLKFWDFQSGLLLKSVGEKEEDYGEPCFIDPAGRYLVTRKSGTLCVWDLDFLKVKYSFDPYDNRVPKPVSVTVDGDFIITAKPIELWDIDTGQKVKG